MWYISTSNCLITLQQYKGQVEYTYHRWHDKRKQERFTHKCTRLIHKYRAIFVEGNTKPSQSACVICQKTTMTLTQSTTIHVSKQNRYIIFRIDLLLLIYWLEFASGLEFKNYKIVWIAQLVCYTKQKYSKLTKWSTIHSHQLTKVMEKDYAEHTYTNNIETW